MQSVNNKALIEELDKLLERLHVPNEVCPSYLCLPAHFNLKLTIFSASSMHPV